jgi:hypothetical protein
VALLAYGFISFLGDLARLGITTLSDFLKIGELNFWRLLFKFIYVPISICFLIGIIVRVVELGGW